MKILNKAVLPAGFLASGISCGIKKSGKPDLALFYSQTPATPACLFTANSIKAAPLLLNKLYLKKGGSVRAIIVNSGNANCFTGKAGIKDAEEVVSATVAALNNVGTGFKPVPTKINQENVLVNSTGIIGKRLPVSKITSALPRLVKELSSQGILKAQKAIRTTDTFDKAATIEFNIGGKSVSICAVAKGAGMICPNVATMLVFIFTDAAISREALKKALSSAADKSFNCITVDGCMSTNDSVMMLANGASGARLLPGKSLSIFEHALDEVCLSLAKLVVRDGEGISKFIEIKVYGAKNFHDARVAALSIANSNLFKTAVYGENPNFGRIAGAVGACGIEVQEKDLLIKLGPLGKKDVHVDVSLGRGKGSAVVYTTDLTPEYIKINAEYN
ncbi:MAG: bifunctional glutamate N-acetyltransferase/amino-acid acetyltransferase ArgJ [Candidatus Omnitrophota bacterium]|nr:bifunctional glutamate N-acetyltransferase/amino-acid acetyltransferase ArgJ [Candidatus Omnitrophota bacterium]